MYRCICTWPIERNQSIFDIREKGKTSPQGVPEDHVQLISCPSLIVKNNNREDNFRRKKPFAWLLVQISYERNQKGSFYIFSYTRNYEQSDRLDNPWPISALQLRCWVWYGSLGLIPGSIWKMSCNNLLLCMTGREKSITHWLKLP
jgi:hypothetical protein